MKLPYLLIPLLFAAQLPNAHATTRWTVPPSQTCGDAGDGQTQDLGCVDKDGEQVSCSSRKAVKRLCQSGNPERVNDED